METTIHEEPVFIVAGRVARFLNHIADSVVFMLLIMIVSIPMNLLNLVSEEGSPWLGLLTILVYVFYFTLSEHYTGKTIGKILTHTKVIGRQGEKPSFQRILLRSVCRLIPFDNICVLFDKNGWHDSFSKTLVVYDK